MKKLLTLFLLVFLFPSIATAQEDSNSTPSYGAIVKIVTYYEDEDFKMTPAQSGTGIIIREDGIILTNNHVIEVLGDGNNDIEDGLKICITKSSAEEPTCEYMANVIKMDKERDIALLKIKKVEGVSELMNFDTLTRARSKTFTEGDAVKALGYLSVGGDTITVSSGTIVGSMEKYSSL